MKNLYVSQLSNQSQKAIKTDLINTFNELNFSPSELEEALENALDSKLTDLEDTIDITPYI